MVMRITKLITTGTMIVVMAAVGSSWQGPALATKKYRTCVFLRTANILKSSGSARSVAVSPMKIYNKLFALSSHTKNIGDFED